MQTATIVLEVLLGVAFLGAGERKLAGAKDVKELFKYLQHPLWFTYVAGVVEIMGAPGMLVGTFSPTWGPPHRRCAGFRCLGQAFTPDQFLCAVPISCGVMEQFVGGKGEKRGATGKMKSSYEKSP